MSTARIYRPAKTVMQSGRGRAQNWVLEFEAEKARRIDPLMGWTSVSETRPGQVQLAFASKEEAIGYAKRHSIPYQVFEAAEATPVPKAYSDNFAFRRRLPWTH
jgi:uncharacterized membrane protein (UPF0127 family)